MSDYSKSVHIINQYYVQSMYISLFFFIVKQTLTEEVLSHKWNNVHNVTHLMCLILCAMISAVRPEEWEIFTAAPAKQFFQNVGSVK